MLVVDEDAFETVEMTPPTTNGGFVLFNVIFAATAA